MLSSTQCCTECSACAKNQERREQLVVSDAGTLLHGRLQGCSCGNVTLLLHCLVCVYVCGVVSWSHRYGDYFKISSTVVIAVIYIKVSREILAVFEPYLPKINDKLLLKADMSVEFLSSAHVVCMIVGFCMVVLFVLGVPVGTALLIHFQKDKILSGSKNFRRKYVPHPFMLLPLSLLWLVLCCGVVWCVVVWCEVGQLVFCCGLRTETQNDVGAAASGQWSETRRLPSECDVCLASTKVCERVLLHLHLLGIRNKA